MEQKQYRQQPATIGNNSALGTGLPVGTILNHPCPDCGASMCLRNTKYGLRYLCCRFPTCKGSHGAHPSGHPLGVPADSYTKQKRIQAHHELDSLWRGPQKEMNRTQAYKLMQELLGLSEQEAHIGLFTAAQCVNLINKLRVRQRNKFKKLFPTCF
ncbi:MAG TPA: zinc-finger-containing protein [Acidobacteriota bacterium]|nr:zinc-finger-containing protein [Acidobacteriota bacterium]